MTSQLIALQQVDYRGNLRTIIDLSNYSVLVKRDIDDINTYCDWSELTIATNFHSGVC